MSELPVRAMILYKHGVGYFVREGQVSGQEIALTFRKDEINDVLKSLAVFDRTGGQILGIHYQTPMDKPARLASSSIRLSSDASLRDLIRDLRGRRVTMQFESTPGSMESIEGRVIGVDDPHAGHNELINLEGIQITILTSEQQVRVNNLNHLRMLTIHDEQSTHDLTYFLDTSMSEDDRRTVNVRLTDGEHNVFVSYVAPSPTWRVSYRIVAETDATGETGRALLQGWGLFDNRLDEDLDNIQVTLVAGQPISFIYELYASRIPLRPTVQDEARVAPGPIEFAGAMAEMDEAVDFLEEDKLYFAQSAAPPPAGRARMPSPKAQAQSVQAQATTADKGEFFQYIVTTPVSVKRGESALVPIISSEVKYNRELLFNADKLPDHPVAALRYDNSTGLTLERGPVTVVENGDYKGEAVVSFTKAGHEVYLAYAVELGVTITRSVSHSTNTVALRIQGEYMVYEEYEIRTTTFEIENTTERALTITIEMNIVDKEYTVYDLPEPDVETAAERRWRVSSAAQGKTTLVVKERRLNKRYSQLRTLNRTDLDTFLKNHWLEEAIVNELRGIIQAQGAIQEANKRLGELDVMNKKIYDQQEQLRANMQALNATGDEAEFRKRIVRQLEESQNQLDRIEQERAAQNQAIATAKVRIDEIIASLGS